MEEERCGSCKNYRNRECRSTEAIAAFVLVGMLKQGLNVGTGPRNVNVKAGGVETQPGFWCNKYEGKTKTTISPLSWLRTLLLGFGMVNRKVGQHE
jgi:hypothetical protein